MVATSYSTNSLGSKDYGLHAFRKRVASLPHANCGFGEGVAARTLAPLQRVRECQWSKFAEDHGDTKHHFPGAGEGREDAGGQS